jgi:hypothetical protein
VESLSGACELLAASPYDRARNPRPELVEMLRKTALIARRGRP